MNKLAFRHRKLSNGVLDITLWRHDHGSLGSHEKKVARVSIVKVLVTQKSLTYGAFLHTKFIHTKPSKIVSEKLL